MPPSHLTRHVFRRILANEPIVHRGCLRRQAYSSIRHIHAPSRSNIPRHGAHISFRQQRRTFFNFNMFAGRKKRDSQEPDMDPGIEEMMQLAKLERMRARLPPPEDVALAFKRLLTHKRKKESILEDTQAQLALQSLRYCARIRADRQAHGEPLDGLIDTSTLKTAADVLYRRLQVNNAAHPELAKAVYDEIVALNCKKVLLAKGLQMYVRNLSYSGQALRAREVLLESESTVGSGLQREPVEAEMDGENGAAASQRSSSGSAASPMTTPWSDILHGIAQMGDEAALLATFDMLRSRNVHHVRPVKQTMLAFYLRGSNTTAVKIWFEDLWQTLPPRVPLRLAQDVGEDLRHVLRWCLLHDELEYGHQIVRDAMKNNPPKPIWDAIFVWAAGTGKGADEINRMLSVMEASNASIPENEEQRIPDIATINALVEFAISKNDPYLAERFIAIGKARSIEPNARTYVLQMQYRLKVSDVDGALTAYANSQAMDLSSNEDVPTVNALIVALCKSRRHDFDSIMNVAADLSDRQARFDASTVSALTLLHLGRDEIHDVVDLLNTHAFHYSSTERSSILTSLLSYAMDPDTPTSRTWDAYTILRSIFDETPRPLRTELMLEFFRRGRPDMATHVFNGMRSHSRADTIPTIETYVAAFLGSAKLKDLESLEVIHNQLKLDVNINPSTRLWNSLILGYTACEQPRRALRFWDDISASKEGPTYNSIHITFRACEKAPFGDLKARELWGKLRKMRVDLDQALWASYVGALAGNGDLSYVFAEIEKGEREGEVVVDSFVLGSLFNAAPGQGKQRDVERWGRERWPHIWEELEEVGVEVEENGMRLFKIDRSVTP